MLRRLGPRDAVVRPQTLLTSLVDPEAFPADEIAMLYHERWELELGYDEILGLVGLELVGG